jgi:hypothetical protein
MPIPFFTPQFHWFSFDNLLNEWPAIQATCNGSMVKPDSGSTHTIAIGLLMIPSFTQRLKDVLEHNLHGSQLLFHLPQVIVWLSSQQWASREYVYKKPYNQHYYSRIAE